MLRIAALAGGIGGARFLRGLRQVAPQADITAVVNTADDITLFGLRICPDLDTVMYTLGEGINEDQGWGRRDESFRVKSELSEYGIEPMWFGLGDRDLATHIVRTQMLDAGYLLSDITAALCARWNPGLTLLPMSNDRVETHVEVEQDDEVQLIHFQEWWIRYRAALPARKILAINAENAQPAPGVIEAISQADVVLLPPSNPVVSIGTILQVPGIAAAMRATSAPVIGISPIVHGAPVRGMADACLTAINVESSAHAVAAHYGARGNGGLLDGWLVADGDGGAVDGITVLERPLMMSSIEATAEIAQAALDLASDLVAARP